MASKKVSWLKRTDRGWFADATVLFQGDNARTVFDPVRLSILKGMIKRDGVKQALLVRRVKDDERGHLEIFDGERRMRCVRELIKEGHYIADANGIFWVPVDIQKKSKAELLILAAQTAEGKEKLDPLDESGMIAMLLSAGLKKKEIAEGLGHNNTTWVTNREKLQLLTPKAKKALRKGTITLTLAQDMSGWSEKKQDAKVTKAKAGKKAGQKRAGSAAPKRPGKKLIKKVAAIMEETSEETSYSRDEVLILLDWINGELDEETMREHLALPNEEE